MALTFDVFRRLHVQDRRRSVKLRVWVWADHADVAGSVAKVGSLVGHIQVVGASIVAGVPTECGGVAGHVAACQRGECGEGGVRW